MDRHIELLEEIIHNPRPHGSVLQELAELGHRVERHLVKVRRNCFIDILRQFENGLLSAEEIRTWAGRLLERNDIGYEFGDEGVLEEAIFLLAHDDIYGMANDTLCRRIEAMLERRGPHRIARSRIANITTPPRAAGSPRSPNSRIVHPPTNNRGNAFLSRLRPWDSPSNLCFATWGMRRDASHVEEAVSIQGEFHVSHTLRFTHIVSDSRELREIVPEEFFRHCPARTGRQ